MRYSTRFCRWLSLTPAIVVFFSIAPLVRAEVLPRVDDVPFQPLSAQVKRVAEALDMLGQPLPDAAKRQVDQAMSLKDETAAVRALQ
ncbi:MAG TPA: hypothetical protein VGZ22_00035, partial [Isosphaeraceae bacterium]|nr:hypothetical protein [Isosphaeraceae bacterium]